ncbi:MAG: non-canonical purine NTP pyrophosphatase, partial [Opitutales bacterium]
MKVPLVLATRNPGKLREIQALLAGLPVEPVLLPEAAPEVEETAATFAGNAELKARAAARVLRIPYSVFRIPCPTRSMRDLPLTLPDTEYEIRNMPFLLADDSGLEVDALGGAPGVQSARYAGPGGSDAACVAKLLEEMRSVPDAARTARFRCAMALLAPDGRLRIVEGTLEGRITHAPRGENGFGYDPVFLVPHLGLTTAELSP